MRCKICGAECSDDMLFCKDCGSPLKASRSAPEYVPVQPAPDTISKDCKPISMWGYFGYELLFAIPLVGFILILVFSFGGTRNKNLKNFARSFFCVWILVVVLLTILIIAGFFGAAGLRISYLSSLFK